MWILTLQGSKVRGRMGPECISNKWRRPGGDPPKLILNHWSCLPHCLPFISSSHMPPLWLSLYNCCYLRLPASTFLFCLSLTTCLSALLFDLPYEERSRFSVALQSVECFCLSTSAQWDYLQKVREPLLEGLGWKGWGLINDAKLICCTVSDISVWWPALSVHCDSSRHYGNSSSLKVIIANFPFNISACCFITSVKCFNHGRKSQCNDVKEALIYLLFVLHLKNSLCQVKQQQKMLILCLCWLLMALDHLLRYSCYACQALCSHTHSTFASYNDSSGTFTLKMCCSFWFLDFSQTEVGKSSFSFLNGDQLESLLLADFIS